MKNSTMNELENQYGVVENVIVNIDNIIYFVDFVIMNFEEDIEVSLIFGQTLMKTIRLIMDVDYYTCIHKLVL